MRKNTALETITAVAFLLFIGVILYYSLYPFKVVTLNSIGIDAPEYCRGDWVKIEIDFVKHMDIQAQITWYIVDGIVYELDSPGISRPEGENHVMISKQIPHSILPGKYNLRVESKYDIHPFHQPIVNTWNTPTFTVLPEEKCGDRETTTFETPVTRPVLEPQDTVAPSAQTIQPQETTTQTTTVVTEESTQETPVQPTPKQNPIRELLETVVSPVQNLLN